MKTVNLYFHIPFCKRRCSYCAFYTVKWHQHLEPSYMMTLKQELLELLPRLAGYQVSSVYFGGGTPSLIRPTYLRSLITLIKRQLATDPDLEITLEANPDSLTPARLRAYASMGINRLSIGLQAWQDTILQYFGRLHNRSTFVSAFRSARMVGFQNINIDLIFGIPNQTASQWQESVQNVIALQPEHIACYSLELLNNSTLGTLYSLGKLQAADEDLDRAMYRYAKKELRLYGYEHYEISNFAKKGFQCRHNNDFWRQKPFYGFGAGASSYFEGRHFHHPESVPAYLKNPHAIEIERVEDESEKKMDFVLLALRRPNGFTKQDYTHRFGSSFENDFTHQLSDLEPYNLIHITPKKVKLTSRGLNLYNYVTRTLSA